MLTNFINGCFETFDGTETIAVLDPSDERQIETAPETSSAGVAVAVAAAKCAQPSWAKMPAILRSSWTP
jgi:lactaldehyde dehydrogenase/glycolaldehyde dehydrogenase